MADVEEKVEVTEEVKEEAVETAAPEAKAEGKEKKKVDTDKLKNQGKEGINKAMGFVDKFFGEDAKKSKTVLMGLFIVLAVLGFLGGGNFGIALIGLLIGIFGALGVKTAIKVEEASKEE